MADGHRTALTDFQVDVATLFFSLPSSAGFLLAGGAALVAQRLTTRPTHDLDFFTASGATAVWAARDDLTAAAENRGWLVTRIRDHDTFCRMLVQGCRGPGRRYRPGLQPEPASKGIVRGTDVRPRGACWPQSHRLVRPCRGRDFVDVYMLTRRFAPETLLFRAKEIDAGFDRRVLADMIAILDCYSDVDLDLGGVDVPALREFFSRWRADLLAAES